ncbi:MAG: hypothetical protein CM15mP21_7280 [Hyphomicrobiales bacterium]|nr:MAG: hypothetical protein CM15mP21_7280 [Hyphomicrobiales bacterium]
MEATALPALSDCYWYHFDLSLAGLFGIAIAVSTMLALAGMVVAWSLWPGTDNAGGIAEMAELPEEVRTRRMRWMLWANHQSRNQRLMQSVRLAWARWFCLLPTRRT